MFVSQSLLILLSFNSAAMTNLPEGVAGGSVTASGSQANDGAPNGEFSSHLHLTIKVATHWILLQISSQLLSFCVSFIFNFRSTNAHPHRW
jgi:hypothetical protein